MFSNEPVIRIRSAFFLTYVLSPRICHRFVGFLEEEAVITYTRCLEDLDDGLLPIWEKTPAPKIAKSYWQLSDGAMMRDVLLAVRADEATHRQYVDLTFLSEQIASLSFQSEPQISRCWSSRIESIYQTREGRT